MLKQKKKAVKEQASEEGLLLKVANEIQSMEQAEAADNLAVLLESEGLNDFKLGGVLALYQAHSDWWDGCETFKEYVNTKVALHYRKVMYLIEIHVCLVDNKIEWDTVKSIGWTKLKELVKVLTPDNVEDWVAKAKVMTTLQLKDAVKAHLASLNGGEEDPGITSDVTTMTFKVHADQKEQIRLALDKAKAELNTEVDTVALEGLCTAYLGGTFAIESTGGSLVDAIKGHSLEEINAAVEIVFPDAVIEGAVSDGFAAATGPAPTLLQTLIANGSDAVLAAFEEAFPEMELTLAV